MSEVSKKPLPVAKPVDPVTWGALLAIVATVAIYFMSQVVGGVLLVVVAAVGGVDLDKISAWSSQLGPQFLYVLIIEGLTVGILWWILHWHKATFKTIGLTKPKWIDAGYALAGLAAYFPLLIIVMMVVKAWLPGVDVDQPQQIGFDGVYGPGLVVVFASLVILPAIAEEILFRGFLFAGLKRQLPIIWAALLTSFIFASPHLQPGSGAPLLWAAAADTFVLSLVLIWLRQKTGRLWAPIGLHMLKNSIAFVALFIFKA